MAARLVRLEWRFATSAWWRGRAAGWQRSRTRLPKRAPKSTSGGEGSRDIRRAVAEPQLHPVRDVAFAWRQHRAHPAEAERWDSTATAAIPPACARLSALDQHRE